ncbi:MAG: hypothetical protein A2096_08625 [Spirochaetes bacterium GWF1_41_5]|nr:MAG: hypothetical protein A2096_08625 [Spirochaetes bacterium GWF1_41_5]HBE04480.1 FHA domain-containing protein [Spirochaetia bacterium]
MTADDKTVYKRGDTGKKISEKAETRSAKLKFKDRSIDINRKIYIGRDESNDIPCKDDPLVSRKHALIEKISDIYYISDLGSTNGTYVNNQPAPKGKKIKLRAGDTIRVGKLELKIS